MMVKHVVIMLETSSPAFVPDEGRQIGAILHRLAGRFERGEVAAGEKVRDSYGDPCGEVKVLLVGGAT